MISGRPWARVAVALAAATAGLSSVPPATGVASGAPQGVQILHVEQDDDGRLSVLVQVTTSDASLPQPVITVDGQRVDAAAQPVAAGRIRRTTVLALDASLSMAGAPIRTATAAARAFVRTAPDDVRVGLVTFSDRVEVPAPATTDRGALEGAVGHVALRRGTRVYDAVVRAAAVAGRSGARSVLLLSDGRDQGSALDDATAVRRVRSAGVRVDVVLLGDDPDARSRLSRMTAATGGTVVRAASPAALRAVFTSAAAALDHQELLTFRPPAGTGREADVAATIELDGTAYRDTATVRLDVDPREPAVATVRAPRLGPSALYVAAGALALGAGLVLAMVVGALRRTDSARRRVASYLGEPVVNERGDLRASATAVAETVTHAVGTDFETRLAQRLAAAGLGPTPAEWVLVQAGIAVAGALVGWFVAGPVGLVLFLLLSAVGPVVYLNHRRSGRIRAFHDLLPDTLTIIAGGLSAGLSVSQAVDTVVREGREPMATELRRALVEHRLGVDLEDTLEAVADRMESEDFAWVVMAIRIQREVGGNLAEVLSTVAETLRERAYVARQVRTLSAEGRLSAWILGGLPVVMFIYFLVANRKFVQPLYTELLGWILLALAGVLLTAGAWTMSRLVKVEV